MSLKDTLAKLKKKEADDQAFEASRPERLSRLQDKLAEIYDRIEKVVKDHVGHGLTVSRSTENVLDTDDFGAYASPKLIIEGFGKQLVASTDPEKYIGHQAIVKISSSNNRFVEVSLVRNAERPGETVWVIKGEQIGIAADRSQPFVPASGEYIERAISALLEVS